MVKIVNCVMSTLSRLNFKIKKKLMTNYFLPDDKNSMKCSLFKVLHPL